MKIPINLASQPFQRVRAMLVASVAVSLLLVVTLGALVSLIMADRAQVADVRRDIARLNRRIRQAQAEQARLAAVLTKPENAEVLERSVFINTLLYRKGISWTRIFSDLEKTVPYNVKIVQIRPTLDARQPGGVGYDGGFGDAGAGGPTADGARKFSSVRRCVAAADATADAGGSPLSLPPYGELCPKALASAR